MLTSTVNADRDSEAHLDVPGVFVSLEDIPRRIYLVGGRLHSRNELITSMAHSASSEVNTSSALQHALAFYGTPSFTTFFTKARHLPQS